MPSLGGGGRYGGSDVSGGSQRGTDRDSDSRSSSERAARRDREAAKRAAEKAANERRIAEAAAKVAEKEAQNRSTFFERNTTPLSLTDEVQQRGMLSTLGNHVTGMLPGMDVEARNWKGTQAPAPSNTTFSTARAVGDVVGMAMGVPGVGDMAHAGVNAFANGNAPQNTARSGMMPGPNTADGGHWSYSDSQKGVVWVPGKPLQQAQAPASSDNDATSGLLKLGDVQRYTGGLIPSERWIIPKIV